MANFIKLNTAEQLDTLFTQSEKQPVIFFKHSVTCPISADVYSEVSQIGEDINLVIVQTARPVSNELAARTGIRHESPQAIILKNGQVVYNASHYDVTAEDINRAIKPE
jgi:bacillithiol system protein YtxJ